MDSQESPAMVVFADRFWEIKNLNDTIAVFGFLLTIFSIWLTWWLSRRALRAEVSVAMRTAERAVDRVAITLSQADIADAVRIARDAIDACRNKRWERAVDRCADVRYLVARIIQSKLLPSAERSDLEQSEDDLRLVQKAIEKVSRLPAREQEFPAAQLDRLQQLIVLLGRVEGRQRSALMEIRDEPRQAD